VLAIVLTETFSKLYISNCVPVAVTMGAIRLTESFYIWGQGISGVMCYRIYQESSTVEKVNYWFSHIPLRREFANCIMVIIFFRSTVDRKARLYLVYRGKSGCSSLVQDNINQFIVSYFWRSTMKSSFRTRWNWGFVFREIHALTYTSTRSFVMPSMAVMEIAWLS